VLPPTSEVTTDGLNPALGVQPPPTLSAQTRPIRRHWVTKKTYDPYGQVTASTGNAAAGNPFRFAGGYQDPTGLSQFGQRYYDPTLGRWTQQDDLNVIGDPANGNRYTYTGDDPVNNIDPSGLDPCSYSVFNAIANAFCLVANEEYRLQQRFLRGCVNGKFYGGLASLFNGALAPRYLLSTCVAGGLNGLFGNVV